jgi:hypothetical protein
VVIPVTVDFKIFCSVVFAAAVCLVICDINPFLNKGVDRLKCQELKVCRQTVWILQCVTRDLLPNIKEVRGKTPFGYWSEVDPNCLSYARHGWRNI